jgi:membrane-bound ClpP family serine protease
MKEVGSVLDLPADQLEFDPSSGGQWRPIRVELTGPVTPQATERIQRTIQQQRDSANINFVCLQIESPGGSIVESVRLANFLADLDQSQVRTVAYVPNEARADAMIVAFACDHLVVGSDAVLGGGGAVRISADDATDLLPPVQNIADRKGRDWSLIAAMVDPQATVFRYGQAGTNQVKYLSEEEFETKYAPQELQADDAGEAVTGAWSRGEPVTSPDQVLQLSGSEAEDMGVARYVADDFDQLQQLYQLPDAPPLIGPNWAFDFIDALASPQFAGLLLFVGGFALIAELSSPGLGIGGFLSAVCFVLYFWSNFLHGTAEVLEILLFLTGVACIVVEIFVIPGFGIFGLGGGALVVSSLVLASQTFVLPTNDYQIRELTRSLSVVAMAGLGVVTSLVVLRKYLHRAPILGRIMLMPPVGEESEELSRRETLVDYRFLTGQTGTARTRLAPSGKAIVGDYVVDVITEGELVDKGSPIVVVEAIGNRVVVRAVEANELPGHSRP